MGDFASSLRFGKIGESTIAEWFKKKGYSALPVYEKQTDEGKGPQLYTPLEALIAPDILVFNKSRGVFWIEAKHKTAFTYHRKTGEWNTGIDQRHYDDYLQVAQVSPWPIWLLFLHEAGRAKDTPPGKISPTGLFGQELLWLDAHIHHRHGNWGNGGMVYWTNTALKKIATLKEVKEAIAQDA